MTTQTPLRHRIRIRFAKQDDLRWASHRDLMRVWERLFHRAQAPLSMSEGFHPKPRMNFPSALAVGIAGLDEMIEIDLTEDWSAEKLVAALAERAPPGLIVKGAEVMREGSKKAQATQVTFAIDVPPDRCRVAAERIVAFLASASHPIQREGRATELDLRPLVDELSLSGDRLQMRLRVDREGSARPRELLAALGLEDLELHGYELARTAVEIAS